jgi:hypothetical protein
MVALRPIKKTIMKNDKEELQKGSKGMVRRT